MPGSRLYIVNSTALIPVVQRQFRVLNFNEIESGIAVDLVGVSKKTHEIMKANLTSDKGYFLRFPKHIHASISAGPHLDAMNRRAVEVIAESLDNRVRKGISKVKMFEWVRHELLVATTEGVFGPKNPYRDPAIEAAW